MSTDCFIPEADLLTDLARDNFGIPYIFPYQRLVISNILEAAGVPGFAPEEEMNPITGEREIRDTRPNQIVILPTGAGKSLCFMLPAFLLDGPTLVVFPLLSLIADQARRLEEAGMKAGVLKGGQSRSEREAVWAGVRDGRIQMILTNPETALHPEIIKELVKIRVKHLVIDETHTVSEWGETFRPVYLEIGRLAEEAEIPMVTAFTATASPLILEKVKEIIFPGTSPNIITANPDRPNISYRVLPVLSKTLGLVHLLGKNRGDNPDTVSRPAIVFCGSRRGTEILAARLRERLQSAEIFFYHAGLSREEKKKVEEWFFASNDGILAATCAYGMGVDKANVRTVIHAYIPPSVEAYLQESGRAGRDRNPAEAVLLFSPEDAFRARQKGGNPSEQRQRALARMALHPETCRRTYLLSLMGAPETACSGCDVCSGRVRESAEGCLEILRFFRAHTGVYTLSEAVGVLKGRKIGGSLGPPPFLIPGYGALHGWHEDDIENAIKSLTLAGILKTGRKGSKKKRIRAVRV